MHAWTIIHNVAFGTPDVVSIFGRQSGNISGFIPAHASRDYVENNDSYLGDDSYGNVPKYQIPQIVQGGQTFIPQEDYIDAEFMEIDRMRDFLLENIEKCGQIQMKALRQMTPSGKGGSLISSRTETYKGKPVNMLQKILQKRR